jgi:hypothetical protein
MGEPLVVYKVVKREHDGLYSVYAKHTWRVKYEMGVPTSGIDGTPVFAFDMHYFARYFARCRGLEIWEAETQEWTPIAFVPGGVALTWSAFWYNGEYLRGVTIPAPMGTVICPEITLIERVE